MPIGAGISSSRYFYWALPLPEGFHQGRGSSPCTPADAGHEGPAVSGRLAGLCPVQVPGGPGYGPPTVARGPAGLDGELGKELPGPFPKGYLSGDGYGLSRHEGLPFTSARGRHPLPPSPLQGRQEAALRSIPTAFGQTDSCLNCGTPGLTVSAATANVDEQPAPRCQVAQAEEGQGDSAASRLSPWRDRAYLAAGVPMGAIPALRELVTTDASLSGWGAVWRGRTAQGRWSAQEGTQHINVLELRAVQLALACFLPRLAGRQGGPPGGHQVGTAC